MENKVKWMSEWEELHLEIFLINKRSSENHITSFKALYFSTKRHRKLLGEVHHYLNVLKCFLLRL
jgi:hypothetical protein